jgi:hypothetical protein
MFVTSSDRPSLSTGRPSRTPVVPGTIDRPTTITSSTPSETACLQVVDYFLWALQRMVERREDRFFALLAAKYRLVIDRDDDRRFGYGEYYNAKYPLTLEKLMPVP